ncbi:MAG: hypothetical protein ACE5D1_09680 [Fidelibacterota bacterium]
MAKSGKRPDGKRFRPYTKDYAEAKAAGKFKRQTSRSVKPDLTLTGDLLRNTQVIGITDRAVSIGWPDSADQDKIRAQSKQGRQVIMKSHPVSKKTNAAIVALFNKNISKRSRKVKNTLVIEI